MAQAAAVAAPPEDLTLGELLQLLKRLKLAHLWALLGCVGLVLAGAFSLGAWSARLLSVGEEIKPRQSAGGDVVNGDKVNGDKVGRDKYVRDGSR